MTTPGLSFEIVRASAPVLGLRSDRTAIIALMERGPVETPVLVHSHDELVERFGGPLDGALGAIAARGYFDNGGEELLVTRFCPGEAKTASAGPVLASGPGRFGNDIEVEVIVTLRRRGQAALASGQTYVTFGTPVFAPSEIGLPIHVYFDATTHRWGAVTSTSATSLAMSPPSGVTKAIFEIHEPTFSVRIKEPGRADVRVAGLDLHDLDAMREKLASTAITISGNVEAPADRGVPEPGRGQLAGGDDGLASGGDQAALADSFRRCIQALERSDQVDIVIAPDLWSRVYLTKGKTLLSFDAATATALADEMVASAARTRDRVVLLDPPLAGDGEDRPATTPEIAAWYEARRASLLEARDFAACFAPWVRVIAGGKYRGDDTLLCPPSAYVAGRMARSARERGPWIATGNVPIERIVGLSARLSGAEEEALQSRGVSPLRMENPRGASLQGVRSLAWPDRPAWGFLSTRRLFNYLRRALKPIGLSYTFEPNAPDTWMALRRDVSRLLRDLFDRGAFAGSQPDEAFFVRIDETLNPEDARANGVLTAQIGVAPAAPLEFLVVKLILEGGAARVAEEGA